MTAPPIPPPTPQLVHVLANLPALADDTGDRVSTVLDATLPALRVALVGYTGSASADWEIAPMYQVEVWAEDEIDAERIAWNLTNAWPSAIKEFYGDGCIHGRWVVQLPQSLPPNDDDAKDTDLARFFVTVAFRLTGASHG